MFTREQIDNYLEDFNNSEMPAKAWTHKAHLLIGVCHLHDYKTVEEAIDHIRPAIINLNNANNVPNTGVSGYHETLTRFWLLATEHFIYHLPETYGLTDKVNAVLKSRLSDSMFPYFFYSHGCLQSYKARKGWMEPNLREMDALEKMLHATNTF